MTSAKYFDAISLVVTRSHSWSLVVTRGHSWSLVVTRGHSCVLLDTILQFVNLLKNNEQWQADTCLSKQGQVGAGWGKFKLAQCSHCLFVAFVFCSLFM